MALYMDIRKNVGHIDKDKIEEAYKKDCAVGVDITEFWHSEKGRAVFCFAEAPSRDAFAAIHCEATRWRADEIFEVRQCRKERTT